MTFLNLILQAPMINLRDKAGQISPLTDFNTTIEGFIRGILMLASFLTFGYMLWGAMDWIMSAGDSGKVESARKKITHALIGLVVLMSVGVIFLMVQGFLGINVVNTGTPRPAPIGNCPNSWDPGCGH